MLPNKIHWRKRHGPGCRLLVSWPVILTLSGGALAQGQLVINAIFDSSITSDPNAADIESTINAVIALYEASFSDPITVTINFQEISSGLGQSSSYYVPGVSYSTFRAMLAAAATTANDNTAVAHLPADTSNPVNGSTTIALNLAHGRALGFTGAKWHPPRRSTRRVRLPEHLPHESHPHLHRSLAV